MCQFDFSFIDTEPFFLHIEYRNRIFVYIRSFIDLIFPLPIYTSYATYVLNENFDNIEYRNRTYRLHVSFNHTERHVSTISNIEIALIDLISPLTILNEEFRWYRAHYRNRIYRFYVSFTAAERKFSTMLNVKIACIYARVIAGIDLFYSYWYLILTESFRNTPHRRSKSYYK